MTRLFLPLALLLCEFATLMENGSGVGAELVGGRGAPGSACPPVPRRCCRGPRVVHVPVEDSETAEETGRFSDAGM